MSKIEEFARNGSMALHDIPLLIDEYKAALAEKDAEIAKLKHELKQDEYKFIRNHNDYYKELCGLRNQLAEKDELIAGLTKKVKNLTAWYDKMFGTPCEEIRHQQQIEQLQAELDQMRQRKDDAYRERNQVVAALAKVFPSGIAKTAIDGWHEEWHGCVYIDLPTGQVSWHYHDSHAHLFTNLPAYKKPWDGHTTEEKYQRLEALEPVDLDRVMREAVWAMRLVLLDNPEGCSAWCNATEFLSSPLVKSYQARKGKETG